MNTDFFYILIKILCYISVSFLSNLIFPSLITAKLHIKINMHVMHVQKKHTYLKHHQVNHIQKTNRARQNGRPDSQVIFYCIKNMYAVF